jgi:putative peptidoglycan lipid II flippase
MKSPRLFRSAGIVSLGTLGSRILGLFREIFMAMIFGTELAGSAFFVAFTIPNLFRRLFGEGALSAAFIPAYVQTRDRDGPEAGWKLFRNTASLLTLFLGAVTLLIMLAAGFALRFPLPERVMATLLPMRIMLPYTIWICLAALVMGVLNSHRKFAVPAFTPCILNLIWLAALLLIGTREDLSLEEKAMWMAWAVLLAGVLQFAAQLPTLFSIGYKPPEHVTPLGPGVQRVLVRMGPAALGAAVTQINVLLDRVLAMWAGEYGPSALAFSERLIYLPLGLFATALGTILLPEMSGLAHRKDTEGLARTMDQSLRGLLYIMIPAAIGLGVLASPIVEMVYARGRFDEQSVVLTARALYCYAPGLLVFSLVKVLVPVFYAHSNTRTPVKIALWAVSGNILLNILFILILPKGWKHAGLALGTVISETGQVIALAFMLQKQYVTPPWRSVAAAAAKHLAASLIMISVPLTLLHVFSDRPLLLVLPVAVILAGGVYFLTTLMLRCREIREFRHH